MPPILSEEWLRRAAQSVESGTSFGPVADGFEATVVFGVDGDDVAVGFSEGRMEVLGDARYESWDFALRAPAETWKKLLAETPPPLHHDLVAAWLQSDLTIEGDLRGAIRHLRPLNRLVAEFREVGV
jgi:hypothetical protein